MRCGVKSMRNTYSMWTRYMCIDLILDFHSGSRSLNGESMKRMVLAQIAAIGAMTIEWLHTNNLAGGAEKLKTTTANHYKIEVSHSPLPNHRNRFASHRTHTQILCVTQKISIASNGFGNKMENTRIWLRSRDVPRAPAHILLSNLSTKNRK